MPMSDSGPEPTDRKAAWPPPAAAPAPEPADIGIVAALPIEVGDILRRFRNVRKYSNERQTIVEGELAGKLVALILTGPGRKRARKGAELLLAGHHPRWIVSAGFGGALDPSLSRNDVVFANEVLDPDGAHLSIDVVVHPESTRLSPRTRSGRLITVDRIIRAAAEKAELRQRFGADIVDMETAAVAGLCGERGIKFLSIRVISDDATTDLPPEIASIMGRSGGYRVGAALGAIWKRPGSLKDLWGLREHALAAAKTLSTVIPGAISRLG
jgi:adenosylhomocysteine nucleosidase